jgi:nicotinamide riboside transporter PnuC
MTALGWIITIICGLLGVIAFAWLMKLSLEQKNHEDRWP